MHIRVTYHVHVGNLPYDKAEEYVQDFKKRVEKQLSPVERLVVIANRVEGGSTWSERHLVPDTIYELEDMIRKGVFEVHA